MYDESYATDGYGRAVEVMPNLVAACPRFVEWSDVWEGYRGLGPYGDSSLFADYIVESLIRGESGEVQLAFDAVERLLETGDSAVRDVLLAGLLERLADALFHADLGLESVRPSMGPKTSEAWDVVRG